MTTKTALVGVALLLLASGTSLQARVPEAGEPLFRPSHRQVPPHEPDSRVLREAAIDVDLRLVRDPAVTKLKLPLLQGTASLGLVRKSRRVTPKGSVVWSGQVDGQPGSTVVLSAGNKDVLIGSIATQPTSERGASYYEIRYLGRGLHVFRQFDPSTLPPESNPTVPTPPEPPVGDSSADEPLETCSTDAAGTIDALVLYTWNARDAAGGPEAMEESINVYVEQTNQSFENSGVTPRLRLVGTGAVDYTESGDPENDRTRLKEPGGKLKEAHGMRDAVGADVVLLVVEYRISQTWTFGCGSSYVMENVSNAFESSAFAAVPRVCADRSYSFPHELGHIFGARHDWFIDQSAASPNAPFPFSHGFVHFSKARGAGPAFRTVMAYKLECAAQNQACDRVLYWSNPNGPYPPSGVMMGDVRSNATETLNQTASTVANFRCHKN